MWPSKLRLPWLLLATAALGCDETTHPGSDGGSAGSSGEAGGSLVVEPMMYVEPELAEEVVLTDGQPMELWRAPQGGHVLLVAARVTGMQEDSYLIKLTGRVRDPETRVIVAEDIRTVSLEDVPDAPGVKQTVRSTRSQASHVPVCPDYDPRDIVSEPYLLEVEVEELSVDGSSGAAAVTVVPTCMQSDDLLRRLCECECEENYVLGKCAIALSDAGADGG